MSVPVNESIQVTCWGCRGSCPAPYENRLLFGGNTSCYSIEWEDKLLILDGGTGLAGLGEVLENRPGADPIPIFISHLHLDHISGIPFFKPLYQPGRRIILYGAQQRPGELEQGLKTLIGPPYWPVSLGDGAAEVAYRGLSEGSRLTLPGGIVLETLRAGHPGKTLLYSFTAGGKKIVSGLDCELNDPFEDRMASFAWGADLLICDAQYSPGDYASHRGWGHSTWRDGVRLAERCQAKRVCFSHFAWEYTDETLLEMEEELRETFDRGFFAREQERIMI